MKHLLLLVLLTLAVLCNAAHEDLSGKMFTFPQKSNTAHVRLTLNRGHIKAFTVCLRSFTDLTRDHSLFSMSTHSFDNDLLIFKPAKANQFNFYARNQEVDFDGQDYQLNTWNSICSTWDSESGVGQLWLNGKPSSRKCTVSSKAIEGLAIITLGQEQDSFGGGFHSAQSFVGMLSDVHMWDHIISPCEIQLYAQDLTFSSGNLLNWRALTYEIRGRVLLENKQSGCGH